MAKKHKGPRQSSMESSGNLKQSSQSLWNVAGAVRFIFSRTLVFYLAIVAISFYLVRYEMISVGLKARLLNELMPSSFSPLVSLEAEQRIDTQLFQRYYLFYQTLASADPARAESWGMLGFIASFTGDLDQATKYYQKAIELKPDYFWFYYNQGVVHVRNRNDGAAIMVLEKAVRLAPGTALDLIRSSKIVYWPIMKDAKMTGDDLTERLRIGYRNVYLLLIGLYEKSGNYAKMLEYAGYALASNVKSQDLFYYYAGLSSWKLGQANKAEANLYQSIQYNPRFYEAHTLLAEVLQKTKGPEAAREAKSTAENLLKEGQKPFYLRDIRIRLMLF